MTICSASRQESFLIYTAYNTGSQYLRNGFCTYTLGELVYLSPAFSVSQPATLDPTDLSIIAKESFIDYLGFSGCIWTGNVNGKVVNVAPATVTAAPASSISSLSTPITSARNQNQNLTQSDPTRTHSPNQTSTQPVPTQPSGSHQKTIKVATGVACPIAILGLALLAFLVHKRRKAPTALKQEAEDASSQNKGSPHEDTQPYLQRKAELEAEEKQKHELEARERRFEMGGEGERYELPTAERDSMRRTTQELRGEEHSAELGISH